MAIEGYVDEATTSSIIGWLYRNSDPDAALDVEIVADGRVVATLRADAYRADLQQAGKGNGRHAFSFNLPAGSTSATSLRARPAGQRWYLQLAQNAFSHFYASFRHSCEFGLPEVRCGFSPTPAPDPTREIALAKRILAAYGRAMNASPASADRHDNWTHVQQLVMGDYLDILRRNDAEAFAQYMRDFYARPVSHGTYQGEEATRALEVAGGSAAATFQDWLASLAESVGVARVEDPLQHGHYGENLFREPNELVDAIDAAVGVSIVPPAVSGGKFGIQTRAGLLNGVDLRGFYAAHRIKELIGGERNASVCEIGGGIGTAAYFAYRLGIRNITIIDLPIIGVMQAYWLIQALPDAPIVLYGETDPAASAIRLLPPPAFGDRKHDLVYNQDSFPEMHRDYIVEYLRTIRKVAPALLSINQEAEGPQTATSRQLVLHEIVSEVGGFRRLYRFPHWLRVGYVEELYAVNEVLYPSRWTRVLNLFGGR